MAAPVRLEVPPDVTAPVVVGCSGGADSLALLALAVDGELEPIAVHVDHGLRPGSEDEAGVVADAAARLGARFDGRRVTIAAGTNVEARAHAARYEALDAARVAHGATAVLVAHTADDQAETVLLNLLRGSGSAGLAGMPARRGHVVRPLLGARRADVRAECTRRRLVPFEDPSNADLAFRRNWIRHEVMPLLERGAGRDLTPVLTRQAEVLRAESDFLDALARAAWPGEAGARGRDLAALPVPLARRAVRCWLGPPPPALDEVDAVLAVAHGERRAVDLAGGRRVQRSGGVLHTGSARRAGACDGADERLTSVTEELTGRGRTGESVEDAHLGRVVVGAEELQQRVAELGKEITSDYAGHPPLLVGVLKGAFVFMSDLSRSIDLPVEFDFMAVSSYGSATRTSGVVRIEKDLEIDLSGRHVLIVEDIVDSGLTLAYLRKNLAARGPASLEVCALLLKEGLQRNDLDLRYVGFRIPPDFVVGYGLDVDQRYRNLPAVYEYTGSLSG